MDTLEGIHNETSGYNSLHSTLNGYVDYILGTFMSIVGKQ